MIVHHTVQNNCSSRTKKVISVHSVERTLLVRCAYAKFSVVRISRFFIRLKKHEIFQHEFFMHDQHSFYCINVRYFRLYDVASKLLLLFYFFSKYTCFSYFGYYLVILSNQCMVIVLVFGNFDIYCWTTKFPRIDS